jgi:hypothetical protein
MAPSVLWTAAATPEFLAAPVPVANGGCVEAPILLLKSGLTAER